MSLPFLNRESERRRLVSALRSGDKTLVAVYGRRRCGKSRLLKELIQSHDVYFLADAREMSLQISALADAITEKIPHFSEAVYPTWDALLNALSARPGAITTVFLDEFPLLVQQYEPLPSMLQGFVDRGLGWNLVVCGSSQRMMQGLVLDQTAPLYGRATEIVKVTPLRAGWIREGLGMGGAKAVEAFSVWGGVPRYWELAARFKTTEEAIGQLILDRNGVLHEEPLRLLLDDMRSAVQPNTLLTLIAAGCHRLSEIAGRVGRPSVNLAKPLAALIDLGYVRRELPFGESTSSTRRTLYRIDDPFMLFWYRFAEPNRSLLELDRIDDVMAECRNHMAQHTGDVWEHLARQSTAFLEIDGIRWNVGCRWWGTGLDRAPHEIDVVAESLDKRHVLIGEVKWERRTDARAELARLSSLVEHLPFINGRTTHVACWVRETTGDGKRDRRVFDAGDVMAAMR